MSGLKQAPILKWGVIMDVSGTQSLGFQVEASSKYAAKKKARAYIRKYHPDYLSVGFSVRKADK